MEDKGDLSNKDDKINWIKETIITKQNKDRRHRPKQPKESRQAGLRVRKKGWLWKFGIDENDRTKRRQSC